jgi:hypothetical protein
VKASKPLEAKRFTLFQNLDDFDEIFDSTNLLLELCQICQRCGHTTYKIANVKPLVDSCPLPGRLRPSLPYLRHALSRMSRFVLPVLHPCILHRLHAVGVILPLVLSTERVVSLSFSCCLSGACLVRRVVYVDGTLPRTPSW